MSFRFRNVWLGPTDFMRNSFHIFAFILISLALTSGPADAFRVTPLTLELTPTGSGSKKTFRVENTGTAPIAVQISIHKREMLFNGKDKMTPADDDFIIYPPQLVLLPKRSQSVQVRWIGKVVPTSELSYRIISEQLPINLQKKKQKGAQITILLRYEGTLYVAPKGVKPDLAVVAARSMTTKKGERRLEVVLNNRGSKHVIMGGLKLSATAGGATIVLEGDQIKGLDGANVLAGVKRRFRVPWPKGLPAGQVQISLDYRPLN